MEQFKSCTVLLTTAVLKMSNLLKWSEKFYPGNVMKKNMPNNLAYVWSMCDSAMKEGELSQSQLHSILSQDTEFFESVYFQTIFDGICKDLVGGNDKEASTSQGVPKAGGGSVAAPLVFSEPVVEESSQQTDKRINLNLQLGSPFLNVSGSFGDDIDLENLFEDNELQIGKKDKKEDTLG